MEDGLEADRVRLKRIAGIPLMRRLELCRRNDQLPTAAIDAVIGAVLETVARLVEAGAWRHATPIVAPAWN